MKRIILWPYKLSSAGAKELQAKINELAPEARCLRVRSDGRYRPHPNHLIVNWGNSGGAEWGGDYRERGSQCINHIRGVTVASNKLRTFEILPVELTPNWTTNRFRAGELVRDMPGAPASRIYCRTKLSGHSGDGIVVARTVEELVDAPLYTIGIDARAEYRVHVFNGEILDVQKKRRSNDALASESLNMDIRNLAGGWVYARNNVEPPVLALDNAKAAVAALGLDFGAVDIIEEKRTGNCFVLEVNSAPGISGTTCENYARKLIELANN